MLSTSATFQRTRTDWKVESCWLSQAAASRQSSPKPAAGRGNAARFRPLIEALVTGCIPRHSAFCGRGGVGLAGRGRGLRAGERRALAPGGQSPARSRRGPSARRAKSPRRRCGRCRDTRAASGAAALTRCSARAPHARREPPTLACSSGARDGPAQECQGRRRQQQQQQLWQSDRLHQRRQQQPRGPERSEALRSRGPGGPEDGAPLGGGVGSAGPPPQIPPSASSILLRARGGGRARWAWWVGWRGAGPSGEPLPGRSLTCSAQPRWRLCRSTPSWLAVELTIGVRETVYLGCAYFGEFGNEPKSENKFVPNQQLLSAAQRRIRLLGCVCGTGERGVI